MSVCGEQRFLCKKWLFCRRLDANVTEVKQSRELSLDIAGKRWPLMIGSKQLPEAKRVDHAPIEWPNELGARNLIGQRETNSSTAESWPDLLGFAHPKNQWPLKLANRCHLRANAVIQFPTICPQPAAHMLMFKEGTQVYEPIMTLLLSNIWFLHLQVN